MTISFLCSLFYLQNATRKKERNHEEKTLRLRFLILGIDKTIIGEFSQHIISGY